MAELSPALASALAERTVLLFGAVEINFPSGVVRLLDGAGEVMIGGQKCVGRDPAWGVLDTIKGIADSTGDNAPALSIGLIPSGNLALGQMLDPAVQGSAATVTVGVLDPTTGTPIGDPYVLFAGELDVPTVTWGDNDRRVEFRVGSVGERLFAIEEGRRLSDAFHQKVWPGELGLAFVTGVEDWVPWGQELDTSAVESRTNAAGTGLASAVGGFSAGGFNFNRLGYF